MYESFIIVSDNVLLIKYLFFYRIGAFAENFTSQSPTPQDVSLGNIKK